MAYAKPAPKPAVAVVAPIASTYNAHVVNHAVSAPLVSSAYVASPYVASPYVASPYLASPYAASPYAAAYSAYYPGAGAAYVF